MVHVEDVRGTFALVQIHEGGGADALVEHVLLLQLLLLHLQLSLSRLSLLPYRGVSVYSEMAGQLVRAGEAFRTPVERAAVRFLSRVCSDVSSLVLEPVERLFAERTLVRTVVFPFRRNVRCCCCRRGGSRCLCRSRCHSVVLERGNCLRNRPEELRTQEEEGDTSTEETVQIQHSTAQQQRQKGKIREGHY